MFERREVYKTSDGELIGLCITHGATVSETGSLNSFDEVSRAFILPEEHWHDESDSYVDAATVFVEQGVSVLATHPGYDEQEIVGRKPKKTKRITGDHLDNPAKPITLLTAKRRIGDATLVLGTPNPNGLTELTWKAD